jgi:hypothetical protein
LKPNVIFLLVSFVNLPQANVTLNDVGYPLYALCPKPLNYLVSNLLTMSVSDEGYFRNAQSVQN